MKSTATLTKKANRISKQIAALKAELDAVVGEIGRQVLGAHDETPAPARSRRKRKPKRSPEKATHPGLAKVVAELPVGEFQRAEAAGIAGRQRAGTYMNLLRKGYIKKTKNGGLTVTALGIRAANGAA